MIGAGVPAGSAGSAWALAAAFGRYKKPQGSADSALRYRGVLGWMSATCGSNSELPLPDDYHDESFAQDAACAGAFV